MKTQTTITLAPALIAGAASLFLTAFAGASIVVSETFDSYSIGPLGGQGTLGYNGASWNQGTGTHTVQAGGLEYSGSVSGGGSYTVGSTAGNSVLATHSGSTDPAFSLQIAAHPASLNATSTGKTEIWISYTLQVSNAQLSPIFYFDNQSNTSFGNAEFGFGYDPTATGGFNIRRGSTWSGSRIAGPISVSTTYYIVGRQSTSASLYEDHRWDRGEMWINPVLNPDGSLPTADMTFDNGGNGQSDWSMIMFRFYGAAVGRTITIDNIAVGTQYAWNPGESFETRSGISPIPEPSWVGLVLAGMACSTLLLRRRLI